MSKTMYVKGSSAEGADLVQNGVIINGYNVERFNTFLGKLLTIAETLGLESKQEEAYKSLIKQEVWGLWEHPAFIEEKEYNFGQTFGR